nr:MAG TPA: hypothetical protein [Caudoviricetes sp.]
MVIMSIIININLICVNNYKHYHSALNGCYC